ncbi:MAG TPA: hypothetical protein VHW45_07600 [Candidatus Sulfotelmatobacter sp.]|jgi:hypothetical protein|nr:hypothetical protein [Candidatus Sulfotelmatobacter sp.]
MKGMLGLFGVALISCLPQASVSKTLSCASEKPDWKVYVDHTHGFCFQYPAAYKPEPDTTKRHGILVIVAEGEIFIWLDKRPFKEERLEELSRSGNPAVPQKIGKLTFYYNGPGGGGVDYSDDYLFDLRGRILHIEFDGPYIHDNHPSDGIKKFEPELLATFRTF